MEEQGREETTREERHRRKPYEPQGGGLSPRRHLDEAGSDLHGAIGPIPAEATFHPDDPLKILPRNQEFGGDTSDVN